MKFSLSLLAALTSLSALAESVEVKEFTYRGPVVVGAPVMIDTLDVKSRPYDVKSALRYHVNLDALPASSWSGEIAPGSTEGVALNFLSFPLVNKRYAEVTLATGLSDCQILVDGKPVEGNTMKLTPASREITLKYISRPDSRDSVKVVLTTADRSHMSLTQPDGGRSFRLDDIAYCTRVTGTEVSPSGKYATVTYTTTGNDKRTRQVTKVREMKDGGKVVVDQLPDGSWNWLDDSDLLWSVQTRPDGIREYITFDPVTASRGVVASNLPEGRFTPVPGGRYLVYYTREQGPEEDKRIYRIIEPDDRQPGWRNRSGIALYDLSTGFYRPLTFGSHNTWVCDMAQSGDRLLFGVSRSRLEKRPTTVTSIYQLNLNTMAVDTLVNGDGFVSGAKYSPDASRILISGSPESLGGVGKNVGNGRYPSMTDGQLYIMDIASREVIPATRNFNPSVQGYDWCVGDNMIYFTAEDKDCINLFSLDPDNGKFTLIDVPEDAVGAFSVARNGSVIAVTGQSAVNTDRLYAVDLGGKRSSCRLLDAPGDDALADVAFGEVCDFDFVNSIGDTINGRYILPADFDPARKYPVIVNYYGGCSPTSRIFHSRYPHHLYAAMGYIVYVVNPSGATGFGQEFSSRHVNTAGTDPARDIIEGTKEFIRRNSFVDEKKIGCIGASYGGFMTMYLQTVSDLFAAAISHAGISDHTSYWGEGYWGYSYSETSMAESYPWTSPDLYVKQSPLYNAHKVNTPILFLHGNTDPNVPPAESHQMFTALKLLGKETALVEVADQEHHILDLDKREMWQNTIFAWFAKHLQGDDSWWEALYPSTSL
jgi:dipeptidyl aminopeptidase/acylaminoacyl peptidase